MDPATLATAVDLGRRLEPDPWMLAGKVIGLGQAELKAGVPAWAWGLGALVLGVGVGIALRPHLERLLGR